MKEKKKETGRINNPVLDRVKELTMEDEALIEKASIQSSYGKIILLLLALFITTGVSWFFEISPRSMLFLAFAAFGVGLVICRYPQCAPAISPLYVVMEGVLLGQVVKIEESAYPGIAVQTLVVTFVIAVIVAASYILKWIMVNEAFKSRVFLVTAGITIVYLIDLVLILGFNMQVPLLHEANWKGILVSLFLIGVAAMNLAWDFETIHMLSEKELPKYYEWYFAFGFVVTLIWLYMEAMQLVRKITKVL